MASMVIAHAAEDALPARALAQKVANMGLRPVIDLAPGEGLRAAMRDAAVTLALWSPRSLADTSLILDVVRGGKVLHARMQGALPPHEFSTEPSVDLTGWRGEDDFPAWRELAKIIATTAGVNAQPRPVAAPAPAPPSQAAPRVAQTGFFQPGAPPQQRAAPAQPAPARPAPARPAAAPPLHAGPIAPPQQPARPAPPPPNLAPNFSPQPAPPRPAAPVLSVVETESAAPDYAPPPRGYDAAPPAREPERSGPNLAVIGMVTFAVVALAGAGGFWFLNERQAQSAQAAAWENIDINDASALRAYIATATGARRTEAEHALSQLEESNFDAAQETDTIEAFEAFLKDFPGSDHVLAARGRIAELRLQAGESPADPNAALDPATGEAVGEEPSAVVEPGLEGESPDTPDEPADANGPAPMGAQPQAGGPVQLNPPASSPAPSGGPVPLTPPASDEPVPGH